MRAFGAELVEHGRDFDDARQRGEARRGARVRVRPVLSPGPRRRRRDLCGRMVRRLPRPRRGLCPDRPRLGHLRPHPHPRSSRARGGDRRRRRKPRTPTACRSTPGRWCRSTAPTPSPMCGRPRARSGCAVPHRPRRRQGRRSDRGRDRRGASPSRGTHNLAEGAGALALAALTRERSRYEGRSAGVVLSGGNVDRGLGAAILAGRTPVPRQDERAAPRGDVMNRVVQPDDLEQDLARIRALAAGRRRAVRSGLAQLAGLPRVRRFPGGRAGAAAATGSSVGRRRRRRTFEHLRGSDRPLPPDLRDHVHARVRQPRTGDRRRPAAQPEACFRARHPAVGRGTVAQGSSYAANEASALRWVHATLVESALISHDLVLPPLTAAERERYYGEPALGGDVRLTERRSAAHLGGSSHRHLGPVEIRRCRRDPGCPANGRAGVGGGASRLRPPGWYRALRCGCFPKRPAEDSICRSGIGIGASATACSWCFGGSTRRPSPACTVGPYQEAMARVSRGAGPDLLTRGLNRLWIGQPAMPDAAPAVGTRRAVG